MNRYPVLILLITAMLAGCSGKNDRETITVFAAASTSDIMERISAQFRKDGGSEVRISSASSGTLARQIEQGAEPDLYISASESWMDFVRDLGEAEETLLLMGNRLVLIGPEDSTLDPFTLDENTNLPEMTEGWFSMGDPEHVPAGRYGEEALKYYRWYVDLKPRILPAPNVRAALSVVELDEADLGIVYLSDVMKSDKVKILSLFPEESHSPIRYFCVLLRNSGKAARVFFQYIQSAAEVEEMIEDSGFTRSMN
ncbi:MAG: molybdate ABC transporter substrate-binding protein [Spirochaetales bacterium]|nr:molybdate ABC transporter substrate-binding protein [Spirochaetales bacterium]